MDLRPWLLHDMPSAFKSATTKSASESWDSSHSSTATINAHHRIHRRPAAKTPGRSRVTAHLRVRDAEHRGTIAAPRALESPTQTRSASEGCDSSLLSTATINAHHRIKQRPDLPAKLQILPGRFAHLRSIHAAHAWMSKQPLWS